MANDPYFFDNFNLSGMNFTVNGRSVPMTPYTPDFKNGYVMREFYEFCKKTGARGNNGNAVSWKAFQDCGKTFFVMDLSPDQCVGYHQHLERTGSLSASLRFAETTKFPIKALFYMSQHKIVTIDVNRRVVMN